MKNKELAQRIKSLRNRKNFSQEELAERSGLSLRTIQRIENGETEPRGDSLKRLALAFEVPSDEIMDWTIVQDKGFLAGMNLSALSYIIFPLLGILIPLIIWVAKKDKVVNGNKIAKSILNFQITWTMLLFVGYIGSFVVMINKIKMLGVISPALVSSQMINNYVFLGIMYLYNLIMIIVNSARINDDKNVVYFPKIKFLREY